ncbi:MAG TPA: DUF885 domain-containing protein [Candidatus Saccharimonadales bacterium]|nr:DUF885 domain-containing protein [Candidatus Saccharimonadales bacterium]
MSEAAPDAAAELAVLADQYWQDHLRQYPIASTALGERRYDGLIDDVSPEARERYSSRLRDLLGRVQALRSRALANGEFDESDRVTIAALADQLGCDLAALDCRLDDWTVDPLEGPQILIFNVESFQDVATVEQGREMVRRWQLMGPYLDQHVANLRRGLADGRVAVRAPVERVIDALNALLAQRDEQWALLNPTRAPHRDWSAADAAAFADGLRDAVGSTIRPALARLRDVLVTEILPHGRTNERPGIGDLPGGADAYRRMIRVHTSLNLAPETLHQTGLDEVEQINSEIEALGGRVLGVSDRARILARLREDPRLYFRTPEEVSAKARSALARATAAIPHWFGMLPSADCVVVPMGEHETRHGTIAYYRQPAPDGSRPGQYFINTSAPETRPRYEAEALAYHESIPGHHLQIAIAQELELPEFRRHLGVTAFWEGWGLYSERLADEMGLYTGDLDRIGMLSLDAWRACRLVVDTGMHAFGWSRDRAIRFMTENTALAPNNIANEVDRYIVWPGQALAYKTGQLEIARLRRETQDRRGPAFDIRAFHDVVLGDGAVGLEPLREIMARRQPAI